MSGLGEEKDMILRECFPCEEEEIKNYDLSTNDIGYIYERIGDDYSRDIFANRLMYSLTGDYEYISKIVANTETGKRIREKLRVLQNIFIYGAGMRGTMFAKMFPDINWKGFIDQKKQGYCAGYPIYQPEDLKYNQEMFILISVAKEGTEIQDYLVKSRNIPREKIIVLDEFIKHIRDDIYFDPKYIKNISMSNRIFMDLGCYDGKDSIKAINYFRPNDIGIYALEPDEDNYQKCEDNLSQFGNKVYLLKRGVGSEAVKEYFQEGGSGARFTKTGNTVVEIDTIDNLAGTQDVGFIKMDIEGYERRAIEGAKATIRRCKPILAVSVYHKRADIWEIPLKILEINPSYRLYFGHYSFGWDDSVVYAIEQ